MMRSRFAATLLLVALAATAVAQDDDDLEDLLDDEPTGTAATLTLELPLTLARGEAAAATVAVAIPPGFHVYGPASEGVDNPAPLAFKPRAAKGFRWGAASFPKVHKGPYRDPILEQTLTKYYKAVRVPIKLEVAADAKLGQHALVVDAGWGTCNDKVCKEIIHLRRNPHALRASALVSLTQARLKAPAKVKAGERFEVRLTLEIPAGHRLPGAGDGAPRLELLTREGATAPSGGSKPGDAFLEGKVAYALPITLAAATPAGPRELRLRLTWRTQKGNEVLERVSLEVPLKLEVTRR